MTSGFNYVFSGKLEQDNKLILQKLDLILQKEKSIMSMEDTIASNEQAELTALEQLKTTLEQTNADFAAEIAALKAAGVDTATLQAILDTQSQVTAALSGLQGEEAGADVGAQPAPVTPPSS